MSLHNNYWFQSYPTIFSALSTGLPKTADIVIVGGGLAGISTLFHLLTSSNYRDIVLLDENFPGFRNSGRCMGQVNLLPKSIDPEYLMFSQVNNDFIAEVIAQEKIECDLQRSGSLRLATNKAELEELAEDLSILELLKFKAQMTPLATEEINSLLRSSKFLGGVFYSDDFTINPYKFLVHLALVCESVGKHIITNAQVTSVDKNLNIKVKNRGVIQAKHIVYCTGTNLELLKPLKRRFMLKKQHYLATEKLSDKVLNNLLNLNILVDGNDFSVQLHDGRLLMTSEVLAKTVATVEDGVLDQSVIDKMRTFYQTYFGGLKAAIEYCWTNTELVNKKNLPLIGKLANRPNEFVNVGHTSYNVFLASRMLIDQMVNGKTDLPAAYLLKG